MKGLLAEVLYTTTTTASLTMPEAEGITEEITTTTVNPNVEQIQKVVENTSEVVDKVVESNPVTSFIKSVVTSPQFYVPIITIVVSFLLVQLVKKYINKRIKKNAGSILLKRRNTVYMLVGNCIKYIVSLIALTICLSVWGVDVTGLIAGLGVSAAIAGLALQDTLKDVISGISIIFENFFVIGDLVKYGDFEGHVIEFGLKSTKIQSYDGTVFVVSNRNIGEIKNLSYKDTNIFISLPIAYEHEEAEVSKVIKSTLGKIDGWKIATKPGEYLGIDKLDDSSVNYMVVVHCNSEDKGAMRRQALVEFKKEFDKHKIKIPYTQIEVYTNGKK